MLADLEPVPKNLIIDPHWVPTAAHELARVTLTKKRQSQIQDDYEKEKHVGRLSSTNQGFAASGFDEDMHTNKLKCQLACYWQP